MIAVPDSVTHFLWFVNGSWRFVPDFPYSLFLFLS